MIDIENKVFNDVSAMLSSTFSTLYPNMTKYSEYVELPADLPCVSLYQESNTVIESGATLGEKEEYATVYFICNVYTPNDKQGAKKISAAISDKMKELGFTRSFYNPIPNVDRSVYRITMRFKGIVAKPYTIGTTTYYKVY